MPIRILAPDVVDQIAAGEVLERPANLIKELVENSLDAGADELEIEFDRGGREVLVADNGSGMSPEDLRLSLQRHATSKITDSADLYRLHSFGFRGEALASIAAVSRMSVTSRPKNQDEGYRLDGEFGKMSDPLPTAARTGTQVRVRDLFANVPARLRFMKSDAAEHTQIKTTLKALALAHEDTGFRVCSRGELLYHWPSGQTPLARAKSVLNMDSLYEGLHEREGVTAHVLVGSPQETQKLNRNLWFFVQGRWVQDRGLAAAVMEAYRNLLMHGEYPIAVVRLLLPPEDVDVNVHPTKAQVKFKDPQLLFRVTSRAVRQVLEKAPWLHTNEGVAPKVRAGVQDEASMAASESELIFSAPEFSRTQYSSKVFPLNEVRAAVSDYTPASSVPPPSAATVSASDSSSRSAMPIVESAANPEARRFLWQDLQVVGQIHQTYIVAQSPEALYLIDQHAAHERVMFERLMQAYREGRMDVQALLLPLVFDFSQEEVEALYNSRSELERVGLSVERMGPESLAVQAIPAFVTESSISAALRQLAFESVENGGSLAIDRAVGDVFASMACHSVVRAGQTLSIEQMRDLLVQMDEYPLSSFCPHGRPVYIQRRFAEIEREFGRIV
ncbi:MAG: DNA mismatch repair endonuclease MutL [Bdellovibrionales bacterium]